MVGEEIITNLPDLTQPITTLIRMFQIIGGILGIVVVYWVVMSFINARRVKMLEKILKQLELTNKKLDALIRVSKKN